MSQPTPPADVVRASRAYLAALLPAGEVADAWHDVLGDVRYWGETDLTSVLKIAHGVVQQRQRATEDARYLALTQDAGVEDAAALGEILGVTPDRLAELDAALLAAISSPGGSTTMTEAVEEVATNSRSDDAPSTAVSRPGAAVVAQQDRTTSKAPAPPAPTAADASNPPAEEVASSDVEQSRRDTIRFHAEAGALDDGVAALRRTVDTPLDEQHRVSGRTLLMWAVAIWAIALVLFLLTR